MNTKREDPESAPYCRIGPGGSGGRAIQVVLPDGDGGTVTGILTPANARSITLALRALASKLDGEPFFAGGWSTAECLRYAADELEELSEQYHMKTRSIENANFEGSRSKNK